MEIKQEYQDGKPRIDYSSSEEAFPISFRYSKNKKRHLVCTRDIQAGSIVFIEKACASIVNEGSLDDLCSRCYKDLPTGNNILPDLAIEQQREAKAYSDMKCNSCRYARYCSKACQEDDTETHTLECPVLSALESLGKDGKFSLNNIRMLLRIFIRKRQQEISSYEFIPGGQCESPIRYFADETLHIEAFNRHWIKHTQDCIDFINQNLPKEYRIEQRKAVEFASILSTIGDDCMHQNLLKISGAYPIFSIHFKHSCAPNCVQVGENDGRIYVRTLTDLKKDTILTVSYSHLFALRDERRRQLYIKKHFWCRCTRCSKDISNSVDGKLEGLMCQVCRKGLVINKDNGVDSEEHDCSLHNSKEQKKMHHYIKCTSCRQLYKKNYVVDVNKFIREKYIKGLQLFEYEKYVLAKEAFEELVRYFHKKKHINAQNYYLLQSHYYLSKCYEQFNEFPRAIENLKIFLEKVESNEYLPKNFPVLSFVKLELASYYTQCANSKGLDSKKASNALVLKYFLVAIQLHQKAYDELSISYGAENQLVLGLKERVGALQDSYKTAMKEYQKSTETRDLVVHAPVLQKFSNQPTNLSYKRVPAPVKQPRQSSIPV
ncbi:Histone-lysine N-methyltransferase Smyd1 [Zancudomyces culisetae]|uniref:Histone-lysine N-methyltransferase Smyd1 n=1 Tax=Zancudomyces culisetae TaxID=1213189 RepID=A0A1R1PU53_ZANCU|nr:Histone-lysine N-methyltransferase Smyd1 [Zancudomyces culisetae]OMH84515.1 Histone-lysine N-methyltransferase Smyd1 [Zancudomyces culisetae]|eukprot:OMH83066.1 Histone-lysine N-methyltransferase Smyd1 [Zancudomyces culisetae]